jgi:hypothetical protein
MPQPYPGLPANLHVEDATVWPTPAEAKTNKPAVGGSSLSSGLVHQSDVHCDDQCPKEAHPVELASTSEDNLSSSLSSPTTTNQCAGALSLVLDSRPLTPGQFDGNRYGLRFFGIGFKDDWIPPSIQGATAKDVDTNTDEPWPRISFRVRPRLHDGWGGWEWAHRAGWYNDDKE